MDINYYKQYEPIFGAWRITRLIGEGSFGKVFEMEREDFGVTYKAALKAITIPASQSEVRSVRSEGMDEESVRTYFGGFVKKLVQEFALLSRLKGNSNVVSYENHQVIEHRDGIGWDILIQMELLTPLDDYIRQKKGISRREVIQLGVDLCKALELCQKHNIIHRDIKPENIFLSENGDFKLGDFGVARTVEKTVSGLSKQGSYPYMAPEVYKGEAYGPTVDLYSLGLVLYRLLNGNRLPFLPAAPAPITYADREDALAKRFSGAPLPMPSHAGGRLGGIVLKACAFDPKDRYSSPTQMRRELEAILYHEEGRGAGPGEDEALPDSVQAATPGEDPPLRQEDGIDSGFGGTVSDFGGTAGNFDRTVSDFGKTAGRFGPNAQREPQEASAGAPAGTTSAPEAKKRGGKRWIGIGAACLLAVCVAGAALLSQGGGPETARPGGDPAVSSGAAASGEAPASGAAGGAYRVAVVGAEDFPFVDEIRASLEAQLQEEAAAAGSTVQVEQLDYNIYDEENEVRQLAQELPSQNYDAVVSVSSGSCARALADAFQGTETAVLYSGGVADPESAGLTGLQNVTGVTDMGADAILQAIQAVTPDAQEVGILYRGGDVLEEPLAQQLEAVLEENGLTCVTYATVEGDSENLAWVAEELAYTGVDAVFTPCGDLTDSTQEISDLFAAFSIPLYTDNEYMMNCGAAVMVRTDYSAAGEQTAGMVFQILQGGALPAAQQPEIEILVNQTVAEQMGMAVGEGDGISFLTMEDLPVQYFGFESPK